MKEWEILSLYKLTFYKSNLFRLGRLFWSSKGEQRARESFKTIEIPKKTSLGAPTTSFDDGFLFNQTRCSYIFVRFQKIWLQAKKSIVTEYIVVWILECGFLLPSHKCLRLFFKLTKLRYHPAILIFVLHRHNVHSSNGHNLKFWN